VNGLALVGWVVVCPHVPVNGLALVGWVVVCPHLPVNGLALVGWVVVCPHVLSEGRAGGMGSPHLLADQQRSGTGLAGADLSTGSS
jgi:hypothetical protein